MKILILILVLSGCTTLPFSEKFDRACTFAGFIPAPITALVALVAGCYVVVDKLNEQEEEDEPEEDDEEDEE